MDKRFQANAFAKTFLEDQLKQLKLKLLKLELSKEKPLMHELYKLGLSKKQPKRLK